MSEERMTELVQGALAARGIEDEVLAVGQFNPRGHSGGMFTGGLVGGMAGDLLGGVGEMAGVGVGSLAGMEAADARSGLPAEMLIGPRWLRSDPVNVTWPPRVRARRRARPRSAPPARTATATAAGR